MRWLSRGGGGTPGQDPVPHRSGGVSAAPGYGVLCPNGRWLKVLQGKLSLCTGESEPSLAGRPWRDVPFTGTPFAGSPW